jgi:hypothetical protein
MGDGATDTWVLDHREIRVSLGDADSDAYCQATHNDDNSEYVGTWHHPEGGLRDSLEKIDPSRDRVAATRRSDVVPSGLRAGR